jgi:FkbM family methyltransferase
MLWNGHYDDDDIAFLKAVTPPDGTFLDIGANVGLVFIPVLRALGERGAAVAIEPVPVNFARLQMAVEANRCATSVMLRQVALAAAPGTLTLVKEGGESASGNAVPAAAGDGRPGIEVPVSTLDRLVDDLGLNRLDTIKIDVEGWEVEVFRGAHRTLERMRPLVYGEFNNQLMPRLGVTFEDAWNIFRPLGYEAFAFVARLDLEHRPTPPSNFGNAVLVPSEKVDGLLAAGVHLRR